MSQPLSTDRLDVARELEHDPDLPAHARALLADLVTEVDRLREATGFPAGPMPPELAALLHELAENPSDGYYAPRADRIMADIAALFAPTETSIEYGVRLRHAGIDDDDVHRLPAKLARQLVERSDDDVVLVQRQVRTVAGPWREVTEPPANTPGRP